MTNKFSQLLLAVPGELPVMVNAPDLEQAWTLRLTSLPIVEAWESMVKCLTGSL